MKVTKEHYQILLNACKVYKDEIEPHRQAVIEQGRYTDLEMRVRWDLLRVANNMQLGGRFIVDVLYIYCNDTHIDTALRSIMKELEKSEINN